MIEIVSLVAEHVIQLKDRGALHYLSDYVNPDRLIALEQMPHSFSALAPPDGRVVACAGVIQQGWPGRAEAWAFFDPNIGKHFISVHRAVNRFFEATEIRRIEAVVDRDFEAGHRWIKMLGFQLEAEKLRKYTVDGRDVSLYSRVKEAS